MLTQEKPEQQIFLFHFYCQFCLGHKFSKPRKSFAVKNTKLKKFKPNTNINAT